MASKPFYVYDLPFQPRRELCRILDADRRWEELGGIQMGVDVTTLTLIGQAIERGRSPSWELLNHLGERNGTVSGLFVMLAEMDHQRAMKILLPYVDDKYQALIHDGTAARAGYCKKITEKDIPRNAPPSHAFHNCGAAAAYLPDTVTPNTKENPSSSNHSKLTEDLLNMNQNFSSVSIQSKLNSLNQQHRPNNQHQVHGAPNVRNFKPEAENCDESLTDNCASEKMKNISKDPHLINQGSPKGNNSDPKNVLGYDIKYLENSLPDMMNIPYSDILKATDNFNKAHILGRGGFGAVYKGVWKGTSVAIKRLMPREGNHSVSRHLISMKQSLNELNFLKCLRFDHILPLYGVSLDGDEPCLLYQLMVNGSLEDRLLCRNNTPPLTWSQRSNIAECTTKGINFLHTARDKPIVHGDIKSANILLDVNMEAKIGDFGLTREGPSSQYTHVKVSKLHGTECYLPPEYLRHRKLSPQVDVYSYGVVLLEMATGLRPYDSKREAKLLVDYVNDCCVSGRLDSLRDVKAGEENMMWFGELMQIGQECSSQDKKKRPTMSHVLVCFKKIKDELSMVDKIRRLSNDKSSVGDSTKLKELSPRELQIFYDIYKEKYGTSGISMSPPVNSTSPSNVPNDIHCIPTSRKESTNVPPAPPPSCNEGLDIKISEASAGQCRDISQCIYQSEAAEANCDSGEKTENHASTSDSNPSSDRVAPVPLITALQLCASDVIESFNDSDTSKTDPTCSNMSNECSSYLCSEDSVM